MVCDPVVTFVGLGWFGGRRIFQLAERSFWSLNAMAIQPVYVACARRCTAPRWSDGRVPTRATISATAHTSPPPWSPVSRSVRSRFSSCIWPGPRPAGWATSEICARRIGSRSLRWRTPSSLAPPISRGRAGLGTGRRDDAAPRELGSFRPRSRARRTWRVAHLSDIHVVGERYGFRLGSGRAGPRGNERVRRRVARVSTSCTARAARRDRNHRRPDRRGHVRRVGRAVRRARRLSLVASR